MVLEENPLIAVLRQSQLATQADVIETNFFKGSCVCVFCLMEIMCSRSVCAFIHSTCVIEIHMYMEFQLSEAIGCDTWSSREPDMVGQHW